MKIVIIILNWNGKENTIACLESIKQLESKNYQLEVAVVDNASSDGSGDAIKNKFPKVTVIENKKNLGFSGGNNVGITYALENNANYVLILNNDTIVDKHLLNNLLEVAISNEKVAIVAPKIYFAKGYEFHKDRYEKNERGKVIWYAGGIMDWSNVIGHHRGVDEVDKGQYEKIEETDFASGCCMLIKGEVFKKVGMLDEKYFLYYEDSDLSEQTKRAGYSVIYAPKAILWHKNAGSAGGSGSSLQDYYITRNRLLFGMRFAPLRAKIALLKESMKLLIDGRDAQKKGILDFYFMRFGKGSYT